MSLNFAQDAIDVFLDTDEFAETIQYLKRGGADPRSIKAIVDRSPPEIITATPSQIAPKFVVSVANDSTYGISSTELTLDGDALTFADREGKAAEKHIISSLIRQDAGVLVLGLR